MWSPSAEVCNLTRSTLPSKHLLEELLRLELGLEAGQASCLELSSSTHDACQRRRPSVTK